jgi:hemoglobin/transferrin/lactoferrin receptor protein
LSAFAQTITVKDRSNLQALKGVEVNASVTNAEGQINADEAKIKNALNIVFKCPGYQTDSISWTQLQAQNFVMLLSESSFNLGGFVVSASRFEESSKDVAQLTTVIDQKQLQFMNQANTADVLQQSGRAFIQKSQMGGGSVAMRGFEANKVLMVVDGVRMNNAIYRGGHLQNVLTVDNNMLEKTEMVFGPGSVVYGSDALGGVVHFYTKQAQLSNSDKPAFKTMAFTRYGTALQEKTGHFDVNIGLKKWAFLSSVTYSDFADMTIGKKGTKGYESWGRRPFYVQRFNNKDSIVQNADSFKQIPNGYQQWDLMQKILFQPNENVSHVLNIQHSNSTDIPRYDRLTEIGSNGKPAQAEWYYGPQTRTLATYQLKLTKKQLAYDKMQMTVSHQDITESRHSRGFNSSKITHRNERVKVNAINADFEKAIGNKSELRYGIEMTHNDVQSTASKVNVNSGAVEAQTTRYPDGGSQMSSMAFYLTQSNYLSSKWILNSGLRMTNTNLICQFKDKTFFPFLVDQITQKNQNTSGQIGLVYLGKKQLKISGSLATGFRSANVDDMAKVFESVGGRIIIPNAYVKPEQTTTLDATINKTFAKKLNLEVNGFYTQYSNALTIGRAQLNGKDTITFSGLNSQIYTTVNAQTAYIYGYYAGMNYDLNKQISVNAQVNYTYGRIKTDTVDYPLDHISPVFGRAGLVYKANKLKAECFVVFNGAKKAKDYNLLGEDNAIYSADPINGFTPAWHTLNVRAQYQLNRFLQGQLAIENIMDQHYRTFSSGYSGAGRNIQLTIRGLF